MGIKFSVSVDTTRCCFLWPVSGDPNSRDAEEDRSEKMQQVYLLQHDIFLTVLPDTKTTAEAKQDRQDPNLHSPLSLGYSPMGKKTGVRLVYI